MGLFYAYAKNVSDDRTWRYLIVFASRTVADEWWRAVSVCANPAFVKSIQRVGPQYYTHEPGTANIQATIVTPNVAPQFLGRVIFTLLADRDGREFSVIPIQDVTDHISGNWFYIRSGGAYWYRTPVGGIIAS